MSGVVFGSVVALITFGLGWWGLNNTADLVRPGTSPERREREERTLRRGARSLLVMSALFVALAAFSGWEAIARGTTQ